MLGRYYNFLREKLTFETSIGFDGLAVVPESAWTWHLCGKLWLDRKGRLQTKARRDFEYSAKLSYGYGVPLHYAIYRTALSCPIPCLVHNLILPHLAEGQRIHFKHQREARYPH